MNKKTLLISLVFTMVLSFNGQSQAPRLGQVEVYKPTSSEKARNFYNEATNHLSKSEYSVAVGLYKKAILEDTNYIDAYDNLGLSFRRLNMLDSAMKYYTISHAKYPQGVLALQNMAVVESIRGNYLLAINNYVEIIKISPKDPEGYYGLAKMQLAIEKYDDALRNATMAEKLYRESNNPFIADAYYIICWIHYETKNYVLAKKYLLLAKEYGIKVDAALEKYLQ